MYNKSYAYQSETCEKHPDLITMLILKWTNLRICAAKNILITIFLLVIPTNISGEDTFNKMELFITQRWCDVTNILL